MRHLKLGIVLLCGIALSFPASAQLNGTLQAQRKPVQLRLQQDDGYKTPFIERVYVGGSVSFFFSTFDTYLDISPLAGYKLTDNLSVGVLATYKFFKGTHPYYNLSYQTSIYGGGAFARMLIIGPLFAHAEIEYLNTDAYNDLKREFERKFIPVGSAGLGLKSGDDNFYSYFMVLYDLIGDRDSPYPLSPFIIKAGMIFSLR